MPRKTKNSSSDLIPELTEHKRNFSHVSDCASILGGQDYVESLAGVWEQYGHLFELINMGDMIEFCSQEEFDSVGYNHYVRGSKTIPAFLMRCYAEVVKKKSQKDQEDK